MTGSAVCTRVLGGMQGLDLRDAMRLHDAHDPEGLQAHVAALAGVDLDQAMLVVDRSGAVHSRFFEFRRLARAMSILWPLLPLFYFPGVGIVGHRVYAWVARNRQSLGCKRDICDVPSRQARSPLR